MGALGSRMGDLSSLRFQGRGSSWKGWASARLIRLWAVPAQLMCKWHQSQKTIKWFAQ